MEPAGGQRFPSVSEIWMHRDLLYYLARREVSVRYKQSAIGGFWAILQPVLLAVVFSVFLGLLAKVPSEEGVPYPVFAVSGLVLWLFFAGAMSNASESTVKNEILISKVYFPRVLIPIAASLPPVVDFVLAFVVVIGAMLVYGIAPQIQIVLIPVLIVVTLAMALGIGLWLSALYVKYRDVHHVVPFMILVGLFISPITYPLDLVPEHLQPLYALNPVVGLLAAYRWLLFGNADWPAMLLLLPLVMSAVLLIGGAAYFQRAERTFADVI